VAADVVEAVRVAAGYPLGSNMREEYAAGGVSTYMLAAEYGVSQVHVSRIVRGVWRRSAGGPLTAAGPIREVA
jgi:hypothetical protein